MDDVAVAEAEKYTTVWAHGEYRTVSPGMLEVNEAFKQMGCQPGESLNDYGSGPARATKWFEMQGLNVLGIDIAPNACETDVRVIHTPLWDMVDVPVSDYGFCCDVMEHIPPEKVRIVLAGIKARTRKEAWFRIATRPDVMGPKLIGSPLHLTILTGAEWVACMRDHWSRVKVIRLDGSDVVLQVKP